MVGVVYAQSGVYMPPYHGVYTLPPTHHGIHHIPGYTLYTTRTYLAVYRRQQRAWCTGEGA